MGIRNFILILIIIVSLFLISCGSNQTDSLSEATYKTGFNGLTFIFDNSLFPTEVYQNDLIYLAFILHNQAGYEINNLKVGFVGLDRTYVSLYEDEQEIGFIEGRSIFNSIGGKEFVNFEMDVGSLFEGEKYHSMNYRIEAEYDSKIEFSPTVCINPNLHDVYDAGCEVPKSDLSFYGQGGSLAITRMKEIMHVGYSPGVEFRMKLENRGQGKVKSIRLGQARLGNEIISCEFKGAQEISQNKIEFDEDKKEAELVCNKELKDSSSYTSTLFVELFYDYEFNVKKSLNVLK